MLTSESWLLYSIIYRKCFETVPNANKTCIVWGLLVLLGFQYTFKIFESEKVCWNFEKLKHKLNTKNMGDRWQRALENRSGIISTYSYIYFYLWLSLEFFFYLTWVDFQELTEICIIIISVFIHILTVFNIMYSTSFVWSSISRNPNQTLISIDFWIFPRNKS